MMQCPDKRAEEWKLISVGATLSVSFLEEVRGDGRLATDNPMA